jgi:hypothetical protein
MQDYIVELPLHTIRLELQDKEQTSLEATSLPLYIDLHNELWELMQCLEQYRSEVERMQSLVKEIGIAFTAMETEARKYGRMAGFSDEEAAQLLSLDETGTAKLPLQQLQLLIQNYSALVDRYTNSSGYHDEIYKVLEEKREHFDQSFNNYWRNCFSPMLKDWSIIQIDALSLDRDFEEFRDIAYQSDVLYEQLIDDWNAMCEEAKETDRKMKQLDPHLKCINNALNPPYFGRQNPELN